MFQAAAATGEMVQRGKGAGDVERRVVGRRVRRAEPDPLRHAGDDAEHDAEVQLDRAGPEADGFRHRAAVDPGHRQPIVEEHHVEAALFEGPPELGVVARVQEPVLGGRVPPGPGVDRRAPGLHEAHQGHLPLRLRHQLLLANGHVCRGGPTCRMGCIHRIAGIRRPRLRRQDAQLPCAATARRARERNPSSFSSAVRTRVLRDMTDTS